MPQPATQYVLGKLLHCPAVPHMRNSIAQGLFGAIIQLQPLPWDDSEMVFEDGAP